MNNFELGMALPTPCQKLPDDTLFGMPVWIKRDDLVHPVVSGNKYRKLKYILLALAEQLRQTQLKPTLVTMGGIWSNHVHATAYAAAELGYGSHALIRGHVGMQSAMLDDARAQGMQVQFVDRITYRKLREEKNYWQTLVAQEAGQVWIAEGGSAPAALAGVAELIDELAFVPDTIMVACGTAATLAGLLAGLKGRSRVIGIAVLDQSDYLRGEVSRLLLEAGFPDYQNYQLLTDFHHGGYAKVSNELRQFCTDFERRYHIPIEPVYTGKVFFALRNLIRSGFISRNETIVVLHTGGLQGARGQRSWF
jgi:1-aminocyclopropane-1-carboxylate deaminase